MTELVIMRGIPASGKTTVAKGEYPHHYRVSRDDIRRQLTGEAGKTRGSHKSEKHVTKVERSLVSGLLLSGVDVVLDDTNLKCKNVRDWINFASDLGAAVDVHTLNVPVEVALRNNRGRPEIDRVPEDVIVHMHRHACFDNILLDTLQERATQTYVPNTRLPGAVVVDLDGTLALLNGRNPYDRTQYGTDTPNMALAEVINTLQMCGGIKVIVSSGRKEESRELNENWLSLYSIPWSEMYLRANEDDRPDSIIKWEVIRDKIAPRYNILAYFDDRVSVTRALRARGVPMWSCNEKVF